MLVPAALLAACAALACCSAADAQVSVLPRYPTVSPGLPAAMRRHLRCGKRPDAKELEARVRRIERATGTPPPGTRGEELPPPPAPQGATPGWSGVVMALLMAGLLLAVGILIFRHRRELRASRAPTADGEGGGLEAEPAWFGVGESLLAEGRPADALRAFYLHGVAALRRLHGIRGSEHLSDRALARHLEDALLREPFLRLSALFQPMRYGGRSVGEETARAARAEARLIARVAGGGTEAAA